MSQSTTPKAGSPSRRRSPLARLFAHQESGLLLVIFLMGLGLTIYGEAYAIKRPIRTPLPEGGSVRLVDQSGQTHEPGTLARNEVAAYILTNSGGDETRYEAAEGWRYDSALRTLFGEQRTNAFLNKQNLVLIANRASYFAIMAVGMTAVIILAGIDLSVGSIYGLSAIVGALVVSSLDPTASAVLPVLAALGTCVGVGALCGLANGSMTVGLRVHPFVITLGMMAALRGLTIVLPDSLRSTQSIGGFPDSFTRGFFKVDLLGVQPVPVVVMLLVAVAGWFVLSRTVFGRRIFAIGGNETAARYAGIPVGRVKVMVYTAMGAVAGLAACVSLGYFGAAETNAGNAYELQVIAATVIGGASLAGGRGTAFGAVLGAIIIQMINNGMDILGVDSNYNQIVMGAAIVLAVVIDQTKQRLSNRRG